MSMTGRKNIDTIKATLKQHGADTGKYLSLNIDKGDLPDGSEIVVMVQDKRTGETRPILLSGTAEVKAFAQNSRFHERVMADGHIFNPYVHRRYIAAHFTKLIKEYGCSGITDGVARLHDWDYAIDILRKEVRKLRNLEKFDEQGFGERAMFFSLYRCRAILEDYVSAVCGYIDRQVSMSESTWVGLGRNSSIQKQHARPMKHRFDMLVVSAKQCKSYAELDELLSGFEWLKLPDTLILPYSFTFPFIEEGAYYTLKHHMMFESLTMYGASQSESLERLRNYKRCYLDLYRDLK